MTDELHIELEQEDELNIDLIDNGAGGSGTSDYEELVHKPSINGVELVGDKTFEELGREDISNSRIKAIIDASYDLIFGGNN
jgi:hypothetical protein